MVSDCSCRIRRERMADDGVPYRGFSQAFYREKLHEKHYGYKDLESFMTGFWEGWACSKGKQTSSHVDCQPTSLRRRLTCFNWQTQKTCS